MNKQNGNTLVWLLVGFGALFAIIWFGVNAHGNWVERTTTDVTFTVKEKERVANDEDSKYLIFTKDEVFENTDSFYHHKYNSSDLYGYLEVGKTYKCEVFGERNPRWTWYRNLVACEEVK